MTQWAVVVPVLVVVALALAMLVLEIVLRHPGPWLGALSVLGLVVAIAAVWTTPLLGEPVFGGLLAADGPGRLAALVILGAALAVAVAAADFERSDIGVGEFYSLLLFATAGALLVAAAADFIIVFVGLEAMSIPLYALVTWRRGDRRSFEGAMKYFLLGAFATAIMVFGNSLLIGAGGSTRIAEVAARLPAAGAAPAFAVVGLALTGVGLLFKLGAAPFHFWILDAYEVVVPEVGGMLAVVPKVATLAIVIRLLTAFAAFSYLWAPALAVLAVLTMAIGNFGALKQTSMGRLLGYSSIAQTGYVLIGLAVATPAAISASITYFTVYAIAAMGAFLAVGAVWPAEAGTVDGLAGLGRRHPLIGLGLAVFMLSLVGIPPLAGFFGKFTLFAAVIAGGSWWLAILGLGFSVVSLGYYGAVLGQVYFADGEPAHGREPGSAGLAVAGLAALTLVVALVPSALFVRLLG